MSNKFLTPKLIKLIMAVGVCILLVFLNPKGVFDPVKNFFWTIAYPFQKTFYLIGDRIEGTYSFLKSIGDLKMENENLIRENNDLASQLASLKDQEKENKMLREQLNLAPRDKFDLVASFVIGQDPQKLGSWLMIGKGSVDGIEAGMPVIVSDGILVGKISEAYPYSSKVDLLTSSSSSVNAVDDETGSKGIIRGEYGLGIILDMVTQTDILNQGDTVVTSGLGNDIPKGLLIGKIEEIRASDDKLFQQALITPRVKYSKLDMVFVVRK